MAFFPIRSEVVIRRMVKAVREWVGPRCLRKGMKRSMSGRTANRNMREGVTSVFNVFAEAFPIR